MFLMFGIKNILRSVVSNAVAIFATSYLIDGFNVAGNLQVIGIGAIVLGLVNIFVKPILKIISFPINIITLGFFNWFINAIVIYLTVYLVEGISISEGFFSFNYLGIVIPEIYLSWFWTLIAASVSIGIINWLIRKILL
ncbi:hypothetical protein A2713_00535 [candidate division WWE3 bacterium RIFCSPHIGHO2_01_FULL_35_17]|uniref:Phage holin family protein n=1 Tax=candidate division WWE3 bacterium RIFCSPHIGHO2_01_FULL_35_17 TaxID=1802614 RepID=A0A1F4UPU9_UNCKA|nr:MAG: hypothetical protein A2713_00535 [candidate division WWE3 bacterium RIFCSPHIGHO2_01_FULL_35_17]